MPETKLGISSEINGQYLQATKEYETVIENSGDVPIEAYTNLAFLYWEFAIEPPFARNYSIPEEWSLIAGERYPIIIQKGLVKYPQSVELHFWQRYFSHILWADEFTQEECEQLVEKYGDTESIVPYFFLYLFDKEKYKEKRNQLLKRCEELPTAKNQYIKSILNTKSK